jgi:hypothetical protein
VIGLALAGRALLERVGMADVTLPAAESGREAWVESLTRDLPAEESWLLLEHLFGVLPLLDAFFAPQGLITEAATGAKLTSLGLFTPTPEMGLEAAAVEGKANGRGTLLHGEIRLPSPATDGTLVLVRVGGEHHLAWVDHGGPGLEWQGVRGGEGVSHGADAPSWLAIDNTFIDPDLLSVPVTLDVGGDLFRCLDGYAGVWALAAALCAREAVHALRRAARTTSHGGKAFNASQWVSLGITEVEIEADLAAAAARHHLREGGESGLRVAAAAARALGAAAAKTVELRDDLGLEPGGPFSEGARTFTSFLGGERMIEHELSRALGIRDLPAEEGA